MITCPFCGGECKVKGPVVEIVLADGTAYKVQRYEICWVCLGAGKIEVVR